MEIRQRGLVEGDYASFLSFYRFGNKAAGAGGGRLRFVSFFLSFYRFGNKAAGAGGGQLRFVSFFLSLWK